MNEGGIKIAVLSGKGGTGKTTVATNMARSLIKSGHRVHLVDLDVEEPNDHIFFDVKVDETEDVNLLIPVVDETKCILCGECSKVCQFGAIVTFSDKVRIFESLCHGCGACGMICPTSAISEKPRRIGEIKRGSGMNGELAFTMGLMDLGEKSGVPIIRKIKGELNEGEYDVVILDSPPGVSCSVVESIRRTDFAILVTEPTRFGLHDLSLACDLVKDMGIPAGIVVNRSEEEKDIIHEFSKRVGIPILMRIPFDRKIAELYSQGKLFVEELEGWYEKFNEIFSTIKGMIKCSR